VGGKQLRSRCTTPLGSIALVRVQGIVDHRGRRRGAQPPGYAFVGQNLGLVIWGHPDIMQSSITKEGDNK
jgi:hypothetical protein